MIVLLATGFVLFGWPIFPWPQEIPTDKEFGVEAVSEPEMPGTEEAAKQLGYLPLKNGGYLFNRGDGVEGVALPALVLLNRGIVELFACGAGGKEHESVVRIECDIHSLDGALTLCGFHRGPVPKGKEEQGERLIVLVQWKTKEGKVVTHRAEDLLLHLKRETPMPRVGWTFVGDWFEVMDPTSTPREKKSYKILSAASSRSLMTTFRDPATLLDNPLPDAVDDTLYAANFSVVPPPGTRALVIIRAPNQREREEIAKIEESLSK